MIEFIGGMLRRLHLVEAALSYALRNLDGLNEALGTDFTGAEVEKALAEYRKGEPSVVVKVPEGS